MDKGYRMDGRMCACQKRLYNAEVTRDLSGLLKGDEDFAKFRLDYYSNQPDESGNIPREIMEIILTMCKNYAVKFDGKGTNLIFTGGPGLGKTFLSACIARAVADNGYSVVYESAGHLFGNLERAKFSADEQARKDADRYMTCDLLIVDDLGTEMPGQFTTAALYGLINDRLLSGKPTIISTNLTIEEFEKRYSRQIASRLRGSYTRIPFMGEDIRVLKNR
jgi:DNA replication protein DnaC